MGTILSTFSHSPKRRAVPVRELGDCDAAVPAAATCSRYCTRPTLALSTPGAGTVAWSKRHVALARPLLPGDDHKNRSKIDPIGRLRRGGAPAASGGARGRLQRHCACQHVQEAWQTIRGWTGRVREVWVWWVGSRSVHTPARTRSEETRARSARRPTEHLAATQVAGGRQERPSRAPWPGAAARQAARARTAHPTSERLEGLVDASKWAKALQKRNAPLATAHIDAARPVVGA